MQIKQISVSGLFGIFDHVIPLNMDDRITVIHGPNGFGKTAMLTILDGLFNSRYSKLRTLKAVILFRPSLLSTMFFFSQSLLFFFILFFVNARGDKPMV